MSKPTSIALLAALALAACSSSGDRAGSAEPAAAGAAAGVSATTGTTAAPSAAAVRTGTPDSQLGLAKGSVFDTATPPDHRPTGGDPGANAPLARMNPEAPPLVPHAVGDFLPITREANACVDCHAVAEREAGGPVPLPASHYVDLRNAPGVRRETVAGARWVCTSCHVGQTDAPPLLRNTAGS
jgi:nitrate reductase cytochrome c-type subunit